MKYIFLSIAVLILFDLSVKAQALHNSRSFSKFRQNTSRFEENKGQVTGTDADKVRYVYKNSNLSVFLLNDGLAYQFTHIIYPEGYKHPDKFMQPEQRKQMEALAKDIQTETYRMDLRLEGANTNTVVTSERAGNDYVLYYNHNTLNVRSFSKIIYHDVYPHIDWVIYQQDDHVKYDFVVHPGGDPEKIKLHTNWVEARYINSDGSLSLENRLGIISEQAPVSYQDGGAVIATHFKQENDGLVSFSVASYDRNRTLVIDPSIVWATYYGGAKDDYGYASSIDAGGNIYLAGYTYSTNNIANGGYQNTHGGGNIDAFLVKLSSTGQRVWATYYGDIWFDFAYTCATDAQGNIYMAGKTNSTNNIASGGFQNNHNGSDYDAFLVKFNDSGHRIWATYYGGANEDAAVFCTADAQGNVYLVGQTNSTSNVASGGFQNTYNDSNDAFLVKFDSVGQRKWATYYGGSGYDYSTSCAVDVQGNLYLAGTTTSIANIANGGVQNAYNDSSDAFLVKLDSAGQRQWATYYGGSGYDYSTSCATDAQSNVYLAGTTASIANIASGGFQNTYGGSYYDAFLVKFNTAGQRQWATYCGAIGNDYGYACATDILNNVYLVGSTSSTTNMVSGGFQNAHNGGIYDAMVAKYNSTGQRIWASYYGGEYDDLAMSCATDGQGDIFVGGWTQSMTGIASGGYQNIIGGNYDAFGIKINPSPVGIIEPNSIVALPVKIYPNPANAETILQVPATYQHNTYQVVDMLGKVVLKGEINALETVLHFQTLPAGVYVIHVGGSNAIKLVKQ